LSYTRPENLMEALMLNTTSLSALALLFGGCAAKTTPETAAPVQAAVEAPAAEAAPASSSTAAADVKWTVVYPDQPDGPQMVLLSGNPKEGAFSFIVKLPAGHASGLHSHPAAFHGVTVSGTVTNGLTAEDAKDIAAGSMWSQAADEAHYTGCTAEADCYFVGHMEGAMGTVPTETAAEASTMVLTAAADIAFKPINPEQPEGPGMVPVSGDMTSGPFTALVRFPAGVMSPKHSHSASYSAAVISGSVSHGEGDALTAGSYWNQVGGGVHVTGCSSDTDCIFFVAMDGAMDMTPAEEAATEEAATEEAATE
jgi:quercetin dioxygenase-like cupin family protein